MDAGRSVPRGATIVGIARLLGTLVPGFVEQKPSVFGDARVR
jgi:hypothetical protein